MLHKIKHCFCILLLAGTALLPAQSVMWPGDVNNNGVVNGADLLYLGIAYDSEGPERPVPGDDWLPYPVAPDWTNNFPNGINYSFADLDNDGRVKNSDASKLKDHLWLQHGSLQADGYGPGAGSGPYKFKLTPSAGSVGPGATINIDVSLVNVNPAEPVSNFYGVAFKTNFTGRLVENDAPVDEFRYNEPVSGWIAADYDEETRSVFKTDVSANRAEYAVTRTTPGTFASGSGTIGSFAIIIEDIIVGQVIDTFRLTIDSVLLFTGNGPTAAVSVSPLQTDGAEVLIIPPGVSLSKVPGIDLPSLKISPNPANDAFTVSTAATVEHWTMHDARGLPVPFGIQSSGTHRYRINTQTLPPGAYVLSGRCREGLLRTCVILQ